MSRLDEFSQWLLERLLAEDMPFLVGYEWVNLEDEHRDCLVVTMADGAEYKITIEQTMFAPGD